MGNEFARAWSKMRLDRPVRKVAAGVLATLLPWVATAHHSFAMYDQKKLVTMVGTVEEWTWANPHCSITVDVPGASGTTRWILAGGAVSILERRGMHGSDIKVGDKITVVFHPALADPNRGFFYSITVPSGQTFIDPSAALGAHKGDILANPLEAPPQ